MPIMPNKRLGDVPYRGATGTSAATYLQPTRQDPRFIRTVTDELTSTFGALGNAIDRIAEVRRREDEREANYRIAQGVDWFKNRWNGQDVKDEQTGEWKHIPGVVDRTWQEMDADRTTSLDEMRNLRDEFRKSDIYTTMTSAQRAIFDKSWQFKENEFARAAQDNHTKLQATKIAEQNKAMDLFDDNNVQMVEGSDSETFEATAENAAARKIFRRYGSSVYSEYDINDERFSFDSILFKGDKVGAKLTEEEEAKYARMREEYESILKSYQVNRITNLTRLAGKDVPGADVMLQEARETIYEMEGKTPQGLQIGYDRGDGNPPVLKEATISDLQAKALHKVVDSAEKALKETRERKDFAIKEKVFADKKVELTDIRLNLLNPASVANPIPSYDAYKAQLREEPNLTDEQEQALLKEYRDLVDYQGKYFSDLKKHQEAVLKAADKEKSAHGFIMEIDGQQVFMPASGFASKSEPSTVDEFFESNETWQNPKSTLIKVESARMAGRLNEADYKKYRAYGEMLLEDKAKEEWLKMYPKLGIKEQYDLGVGTKADELTSDQKKARNKIKNQFGETSAYYRYIQGGVYAKKAGAAGTVDWLADSFDQGEDEEFIPPEVMADVYKTTLRLARAGVDPEEAVRQLIAPSIEDGISRSILERVSDPDYFREIVDKVRTENGYSADLNQSLTDQVMKSQEYRRSAGSTTGTNE